MSNSAGQRISNPSQPQDPIDTLKKLNNSRREKKRVSSINDELDSLVVMLGGEVRTEDSTRWEEMGREAVKLQKLDVLEAAASYLQRLIEELEEVKSKKAANGLEVSA